MTGNAAGARLTSGALPSEIAADLAPLVAFQAEGMALDEVLALVRERLEPHLLRYDHPGFQSMFNAVPDPAARAGGELALAYNQGVTNWQVSPGGAVLEELCCRALCRLFRLGSDADATFMYSGTYANHEALYLALHRFAERRGVDLGQAGLAALPEVWDLKVLVSQDAHFSMRHAVRMLGLGEQSLVHLPLDGQRRIDLAAARPLVRDLAAQGTVVCVVATATGAVDLLAGLAELCIELRHWPDMGVLCFRVRPAGVPGEALDGLQQWLSARLMASGERTVSTTVLDGEVVLRVVQVSPETRLADLRATIETLEILAEEYRG